MLKKIILSIFEFVVAQASLDYFILTTTPQGYQHIAKAVAEEADKQDLEMISRYMYISVADHKLYYFENNQLARTCTVFLNLSNPFLMKKVLM